MKERFSEYRLTDDPAHEIDGIDFCSVAITQASEGRLPEFEHVQSCPCCIIGLRIADLSIRRPGIEPYEEDEAMDLMDTMVEEFNKRDPDNNSTESRRFYMTVGENEVLRRMFTTFVALRYRPDLVENAPYNPDFSHN